MHYRVETFRDILKLTRIRSQRGMVMEFMAIAIVFIVLLAIGMMVDLPMNQSAATATQVAADDAAQVALAGLPFYHYAGERGLETIDNNIRNDVTPFATRKSTDDPILIVPRLGADTDQFGLRYYYAPTGAVGTTGSTLARTKKIFFDDNSAYLDPLTPGGQYDDFKNSVAIFARTDPHQFLTLTGSGLLSFQNEVVSALRIPTQMIYVLMDPAFSMDAENYTAMLTDPAWAPWEVSEFSDGFPGITQSPPSYHADGTTNSLYLNSVTTQAQEVAAFYGTLCFSKPWQLYKRTVVDFVDWLTKLSSFNGTSMVGLIGMKGAAAAYPVIPLYPLDFRNTVTVDQHLVDFPLPDEQKYLHSRIPAAFRGFINANLPDVAQGIDNPSGLNRWELCYCAGYTTETASPGHNLVLTPVDSYLDSPPMPGEESLHHAEENDRKRGNSGLNNWCDDNPVLPFIGPDSVIEMTDRHSGTGGGETVRNLIALQAMRVRDMKLQTADDKDLSDWSGVPPAPTADGQYSTEPMASGSRRIPETLGFADQSDPDKPMPLAQIVATAAENYRTSDVGKVRSLAEGDASIVIFSFGLWSASSRWDGAEDKWVEDSVLEQSLRDALNYTVCQKKVGLTFVFLPMNEADRQSIKIAAPVLQEYADYYAAQHGLGTGGAPTGCNGSSSAPVRVMITDYMSPDFDQITSQLSTRKLEAARHFQTTVPDKLRAILVKSVNAM
ncbi:hypothetical protein JNK13_03715 [bacterium]|nr:hypothetical protein [bacterium]